MYSTSEERVEIARGVLREFDIRAKDPKVIRSSVLKEKSRLEALDKKNKNQNKKEEINFWRLATKVQTGLGYQLNIDKIMLAEWIEIVNELRERQPLSNKGKNGRRQNKSK